jgi:hypothetical protein
MAQSTVIKNFRDGTLTFSDNSSPPLALPVVYEVGDFKLDNMNEGLVETTAYLDRGEFATLRKTNRVFPTFSFTAHMTDLSDATDKLLYDLSRKTGAWSAAVSTLGANADAMTYKLTWTCEGTNFGDSADHTLVMNDCRVKIDIGEGDPNSFAVSGIVYGSITAT